MHGHRIRLECGGHRDHLVNASSAASIATSPGIDRRWSRVFRAPDHRGVNVDWHLLDTHAWRPTDDVAYTVLCVHGNPTWSFLWRSLLATAPPNVRVIAVDQLEMGWSERTGVQRRLADRIADLNQLTEALHLRGPVVVVAHDWGGPVALGWAQEHRADLRGIILTNTAVHQPADAAAPPLITLAQRFLSLSTQRTQLFLRGTTALSGRRITRADAQAYRSPYRTSDRRQGICDFVADIPLQDSHPSFRSLQQVANGLADLRDVPVLLLWGGKDPVFSDRYLHDLERRLPQAEVHRFPDARHLVMEDVPGIANQMWDWLATSERPARPIAAGARRTLWEPLMERSADTSTAIAWVEDGEQRQVSWQRLAERVRQLASGLHAAGIEPGQRVSVLITPGPDLIAVVYALWRIGATAVIADSGLGVRGMRRALRSAAPQHVIAIPKGGVLARSIRIPGLRISTSELASFLVEPTDLPVPPPQSEAVVVFTSGATGPAKGVVYTQHQVEKTRDAVAETYGLTADDALVAAFAPWAVLGPTLGIASAIPEMDVTAPRTLQAPALARATATVNGTIMWASPAALTNVVATAGLLTPAERAAFASLRIVLAAGAPVPRTLLEASAELFANAELGTPYGMTEVLPVCDVRLDELRTLPPGNGVYVGTPIAGVRVAVSPLRMDGTASDSHTTTPDITGEVLVQAPHMRERYDRLAGVDARSADVPGWHRTGDVGHFDVSGGVWVEGRLQHVITTASGPVTPVGAEQCIVANPGIHAAAIVGVGPPGCQQIVAVIVDDTRTGPLADVDLTIELRRQVHEQFGFSLAAVLVRSELPTDIRHNAKVDRTALATWASKILAGAA